MDYKIADRVQIESAIDVVKVRYLTCLLLNGSNNGRYKYLKDNLHNQFMMGNDNYPVELAIKLLNNYKTTKIRRYNPRFSNEEQVAFMQSGKKNKTGNY